MILALPQLAEHRYLNWPDHFKVIRFLLNCLKESGCACLVSLHPVMDPKNYVFIESEYRIPIADEKLVDILAGVDLFIAQFSSTVEWAVGCQIPTIVFHFWEKFDDIFSAYKGVKVVWNKRSFVEALRLLIADENYYQRAVIHLKDDKKRIGAFDGKCTQRIVNCILDNQKC